MCWMRTGMNAGRVPQNSKILENEVHPLPPIRIVRDVESIYRSAPFCSELRFWLGILLRLLLLLRWLLPWSKEYDIDGNVVAVSP